MNKLSCFVRKYAIREKDPEENLWAEENTG